MSFEIKKNPHKIAICGTGQDWNLFPVQSDHTIYALNDYVNFEKFQIMPDILFIMDVLDEKPMVVSGIQDLGQTVARINQLGCRFIAPYKYAEIPKSEAFPLRECVKEFGAPYFTNTVAFMIAHALLSGAKEIDIYGVNQASSSEYFYEKSGVEYWLGVANGRGVKVTINGPKSELLRNKDRFGGSLMYGYNQNYEQFLESEKKYGTALIKQLSAPIQITNHSSRVIK